MSYYIETKELSTAISAATDLGVLTVGSTTDIYPGAKGSVMTSGGACAEVVVVDIISATTFHVRLTQEFLDGFPRGQNYGYSPMSAYASGVFTQYRSIVRVDESHSKINKL